MKILITTEYDKDKIESLGLLKMDLLGLRTLTVIGDAIKFIYETTGDKLDIDKIPLDDEATCSMLRKGDTQGVFQLESGGMTKLVMDLGPESFEDLIPLVALYRPGPLGTGMVEDFIAGRHGEKRRELASFIGTGFKRYFWRYSLSGTGYADHFRSGRLQPRAGRYSAAGYGQEKG